MTVDDAIRALGKAADLINDVVQEASEDHGQTGIPVSMEVLIGLSSAETYLARAVTELAGEAMTGELSESTFNERLAFIRGLKIGAAAGKDR